MRKPWRSRRRERYADDRFVANQPAVPVQTTWNARPGDTVAHAFSSGPGWTRSVCRKERWTVLWPVARAELEHCIDCALLVDGAPGEIVEAWGL